MSRPAENKKQRVGEMFDSIAPTYDALNHILSLGIDRGWRRKVVGMASSAASASVHPASHSHLASANPAVKSGGNYPDELSSHGGFAILDVATGTGDLAIALARALPGARITGIDISENMLAEGRRKVAEKGLDERITLQAGDAEALDFADARFDLVTVAFGVRNFGNIEAGLSEMRRVLKPGGRCLVLEFSEPRGWFFGTGYRFYFHRVLPLVGRIVSRDKGAYTYLPRSVDGFPPPARFAEMLREAGFDAVGVKKLTFGVAYIYNSEK